GLGHVLQAPDAADSPLRLEEFDLLHWSNDQLYVLMFQQQLQAVILHKRRAGSTGRGIRVGDTEATLRQKYPEQPDTHTFSIKPGDRDARLLPLLPTVVYASAPASGKHKPDEWGEVWRYDSLGIGFELVNGKVSAITLYPPK